MYPTEILWMCRYRFSLTGIYYRLYHFCGRAAGRIHNIPRYICVSHADHQHLGFISSSFAYVITFWPHKIRTRNKKSWYCANFVLQIKKWKKKRVMHLMWEDVQYVAKFQLQPLLVLHPHLPLENLSSSVLAFKFHCCIIQTCMLRGLWFTVSQLNITFIE